MAAWPEYYHTHPLQADIYPYESASWCRADLPFANHGRALLALFASCWETELPFTGLRASHNYSRSRKPTDRAWATVETQAIKQSQLFLTFVTRISGVAVLLYSSLSFFGQFFLSTSRCSLQEFFGKNEAEIYWRGVNRLRINWPEDVELQNVLRHAETSVSKKDEGSWLGA